MNVEQLLKEIREAIELTKECKQRTNEVLCHAENALRNAVLPSVPVVTEKVALPKGPVIMGLLSINMPDNCRNCWLKSVGEYSDAHCYVTNRPIPVDRMMNPKTGRPEWCPLVPMPAAVRERKKVYKKILPEYFEAVLEEWKRFELRKDEDDIQVGDSLILQEWDGEHYTGREVVNRVKYVLRDVPQYGLKEGYCVIGW